MPACVHVYNKISCSLPIFNIASAVAADTPTMFRSLTKMGQPYAEVLTEHLNIGGILQVQSDYAERNNVIRVEKLREMQEIGSGQQGTVFEQPRRFRVLKKERPGNSELPTNLHHEYDVHVAVWNAFNELSDAAGCAANVPKVYNYIAGNQLSEEDLNVFPDGYRTTEAVVDMERILPVPRIVRAALAGYFMKSRSRRIMKDTPSKHCLVRTYMGRKPPTGAAFSLRNFPLDLEAMEGLNLNTQQLADAMGAAFAVLHWGAGVDGDGVEFVLGTKLLSQGCAGLQRREMGLYLLDFGHCETVDLTQHEDLVYGAYKVAMIKGENLLYIPDYSQSPGVYAAFKGGYVRAGKAVLEERHLLEKFDVEVFLAKYEEYAADVLQLTE